MLNIIHSLFSFSPRFRWGIKPVLFFLFSIAFLNIVAQENLVPNPSFEEYWECPSGPNQDGNQFEKCKYWYRPNDATSDFFHSCALESTDAGTPNNWQGYQIPQQGNGYVGLHLSAYNGDTPEAEYIQCKLIEPLSACKEYSVSFWVNLSNFSALATSAIGLRFDDKPIKKDTPLNYYGFELPCHICVNGFIEDTVNWINIKGSYVAQGGEDYITIGRFFDTTKFDNLNYPIKNVECDSCFTLHPSCYYYFDSFSIIELTDTQPLDYPNVFTPNMNGVNDNWFPKESCIKNWNCQIFNRWGNQVFSFDENEIGWNGYNELGEQCFEGVYFYILSNQQEKKTGFIHLVR